ncbi:MAG: apolipoprotein N-acyltransferase [Kiritimatiellia bacterium]|jgi:apolipoprotein N-acyltransferase|nr:apolipoprotein N-acyltransferase [Kiritimatiellia bacterium]MDP6847424.1 apolipoprotein N-acyltransferase [Kiritimatiellia bacterium]
MSSHVSIPEPKKKQKWYPVIWRLICSIMTGLLVASSSPPMESWEAAWVALIPMLILSRLSSPRSSFKWGFLSGLFHWLPSLAWLLRLCSNGGPLPLVVLGWLLLSAYCALYTGGFYASSSWLINWGLGTSGDGKGIGEWINFLRRPVLVLLVPFLWVGFEYLRSTLLTGFSWNALGVSQYRNLAIIQVAEWGGVYAVSAVLLVMNTAMALTALDVFPADGTRRRRVRVELMIGLSICALCWVMGTRRANLFGSSHPGDRSVKVAAVQPNIPQLEKWTKEAVLDIYRSLAYQTELAATSRPDLIIWPETALPGAFPNDLEAIRFAADMASLGAPVLVGAMETAESESTGDFEFCNSSFLVDPDGAVRQKYRKIHLVPFGEYIPFDRSIPFLSRCAPLGFSCTPGTRSTVFRLKGIPFSSLICFEDTIPALGRKAVLAGARLLINQTNDAWFDGSSGARQHVSHCVFRCVENRVEAVRSANTGITCHIDRRGRLSALEQLGSGSTFAGFAVYGVTIPSDDMDLSLYTRFGDAIFAVPCAVFAVAACLMILYENRKRRNEHNLHPTEEHGEEDA